MKKHHWINDDIVIDFPLPQSMLYLIEELEKLDAEEDYAYFNYAEALDTGAKELYRRGTLTRKQWDQLCRMSMLQRIWNLKRHFQIIS